MKNTKITQEEIDKLVATNEDFWKDFHESLSAPYSYWNDYKDVSFEDWIEICWNSEEFRSYLNLLFGYPLIKGEVLIVYSSGHILTNYRLIISDSGAGNPSIPLSDLQSYSTNGDGIIKYIKNGNIVSLQYNELLKKKYVDTAKSRLDEKDYNSDYHLFLSHSNYEIKEKYSELNLPILKMYPLTETQQEKIKNTYKKNKASIIYKIIAPLAAIAMIVTAFSEWEIKETYVMVDTRLVTGIVIFIIGVITLFLSVGYLRSREKFALTYSIGFSILFFLILIWFDVKMTIELEKNTYVHVYNTGEDLIYGALAAVVNIIIQIIELILKRNSKQIKL